MTTLNIVVAENIEDYELIDSGNGAKLERFAKYLVVRPDPRALWTPTLPESEWNKADAHFRRTDPQSGEWVLKRQAPKPWNFHFQDVSMSLKPTSFKHVGVFPEQHANWTWMRSKIKDQKKKLSSVLNLFAYTGGASLSCAKENAKVTHVDAAKSTIAWAKQNAKLSGLADDAIRWIEEDAGKFVARELRRQNKYDGILMDPPRFGRGAKNEIWKLEDELAELVKNGSQLLTEDAAFFLLNCYTADISSLVLANIMSTLTLPKDFVTEVGELVLKETAGKRFLPAGIYARASRKN